MAGEGEGKALFKERLFQRSTSIEPVPKTPDVDVSQKNCMTVLSVLSILKDRAHNVECSN